MALHRPDGLPVTVAFVPDMRVGSQQEGELRSVELSWDESRGLWYVETIHMQKGEVKVLLATSDLPAALNKMAETIAYLSGYHGCTYIPG